MTWENEPVEEFEVAGLTVRIFPDVDYSGFDSPRKNFDQLATMVAFERLHREYGIADRNADWQEEDAHDRRVGLLERWLRLTEGAEVLFFYFADYGSSGARLFETDDEGASGFFYVTRDEIVKEYGDDSPESREKARSVLSGECKEMGQYVEGDVWGYVISSDDDDHIDSCWGFYGLEYAVEEAKEIAEWAAEERSKKAAEEAQERAHWANNDLATKEA